MMKKNWAKPELTVMVRNRPEEAVLAGCMNPPNENAPGVAFGACATGTPEDCPLCVTPSLS